MKKIFILVVVLFAMISCSEQPDTNIYHEVEITNDVYEVNVIDSDYPGPTDLHVIVIDSCEYLIGICGNGYKGYGYMAHKGNCKYCAERRKREMKYYESKRLDVR